MPGLSRLTLAAARDGLRAKDFTAVELAGDCLAEIEAAAALNAFSSVTAERALT
jgi:aspartyl-tRNA(Asn)/glutamyl-tRNA(Gln) amidotransferase subunit A